MCRHITETAFFVEFFQSGLYRSDVADAVFGKHRQHLPESLEYFTVAALITSSGFKLATISSSFVYEDFIKRNP